MKYKDVVVEKTEKEMSWQNPVWVCLNFNYTKRIGKAILRYNEHGEIMADIDVDGQYTGYYPAIGFKYEYVGSDKGKIFCLGICEN